MSTFSLRCHEGGPVQWTYLGWLSEHLVQGDELQAGKQLNEQADSSLMAWQRTRVRSTKRLHREWSDDNTDTVLSVL